jgi:hypothetical protein
MGDWRLNLLRKSQYWLHHSMKSRGRNVKMLPSIPTLVQLLRAPDHGPPSVDPVIVTESRPQTRTTTSSSTAIQYSTRHGARSLDSAADLLGPSTTTLIRPRILTNISSSQHKCLHPSTTSQPITPPPRSQHSNSNTISKVTSLSMFTKYQTPQHPPSMERPIPMSTASLTHTPTASPHYLAQHHPHLPRWMVQRSLPLAPRHLLQPRRTTHHCRLACHRYHVLIHRQHFTPPLLSCHTILCSRRGRLRIFPPGCQE